MLRPKDEKLQQIETGLKKAGIHLADDAAFDVKMNLMERMTHYKVPSVSIAVIDENELKLTTAYAASPETIYQAGSVSKPVAALVALLVAKEYGLDLDEDVNRILERYHSTYRIPNSEFTLTKKVTLRGLLSHTAGLTIHGFDGYASDTKELPTTQQILEGEKSTSPTNSKPVESFAVPGTKSQYSGGGTTLVQLILETVTGKDFPTTARKYVLDPLEMKSSGYEIHRPGEENFHPAIAHDRDGNRIKGDWNLYPESTAAGLWSTPTDLARFIIEIQKAYKGESDKIPQDVVQQMLTKQAHGKFGLGPEISMDNTSLCFSHGGKNVGFQCLFMGFNNGKGAVIMTNSNKGASLIDEIIPSIAEAYEWPVQIVREVTNSKIKQAVPIDPAIYEDYVGDYLVSKVAHFKFTTENDKFFVWLPFPNVKDSPTKYELTSESETSFFHISDKARFEFVFPSRKADTFTCTLGPGERMAKELKDETSPQVSLSSTSKVALAMPKDATVESKHVVIASNESPSQGSEKSPAKKREPEDHSPKSSPNKR